MDMELTSEELGTLFGAVKRSVEAIRQPSKKSYASIDGEIYTNLRREFSCGVAVTNMLGSDRLAKYFQGRRDKNYGGLSYATTGFIRDMVDNMKRQILDGRRDRLDELNVLLAGMTNAVTMFKEVNSSGDLVIKEVAEINKLLNPSEEGIEDND